LVILKPPHQGDPLEEVWLSGDTCMVSGVYEEESGHRMAFRVGDIFPSSADDFGVAARRRLVLFL
jgi:hypothetical protein